MELVFINPNTLINPEMICSIKQTEGKLLVMVGIEQYIVEQPDEFLAKIMKSNSNLNQQYFAG